MYFACALHSSLAMSAPASSSSSSSNARVKTHVYVLHKRCEGYSKDIKVFRTLAKAEEAKQKILAQRAREHWDWLRAKDRCSETKVVLRLDSNSDFNSIVSTMGWLVNQLGTDALVQLYDYSDEDEGEPVRMTMCAAFVKVKKSHHVEFGIEMSVAQFLSLVGWSQATAFEYVNVWRNAGSKTFDLPGSIADARNTAYAFQLARFHPGVQFDQLSEEDYEAVKQNAIYEDGADGTDVTVKRYLLRA